MRKCYLSLVAACLVVAAPVFAADLKPELSHPAPYNTGRTAFVCDDDLMDSAFYQDDTSVWGNAFDVGAGGPLSFIEFWHYGWFTLQGPYTYNLHVFDEATCTSIGVVEGLEAADAFDHDELEEEDLCTYGINVSGAIVVGVQSLSCAAPGDCYPDVYMDFTAPVNECGRNVDLATNTGCDTPVQSSSGPVDFLLRISVDECGGTPTQEGTWGSVKDLYR